MKGKRAYLQVLAHLLRDRSKPNTREIIDRESCILRVIQREHSPRQHPNLRIRKPLFDSRQSHRLHNLRKHDLHKDTARTRRGFFGDLDGFEYGPGDGVVREEMSEETRDVSQTVGFVAVDRVVVVVEGLLEAFVPDAVELAETLGDEAVEC